MMNHFRGRGLAILGLSAVLGFAGVSAAGADERGVLPPCDQNGNGDVNAADVAIFVNKLLGVTPTVPFDRADLNFDGHVDGRDIEGFVCCMLGTFC